LDSTEESSKLSNEYESVVKELKKQLREKEDALIAQRFVFYDGLLTVKT